MTLVNDIQEATIMSELTKNAIMQSFFKLLNEKPFHQITVKSIVDDCGVNRKTFYYYFHDTYDLAEKYFQALIEKFKSSSSGKASVPDEILEMLQFLKANRKATLHIYNSVSHRNLEDFIYQTSYSRMEEYLSQFPESCCTRERRRITIDCYAAALTGLSLRWIGSGMGENFEEMIKKVFSILSGLTNCILNYHQ